MINIRRSVFETNSSSSHSLAYAINSLTGEPREPEIDYDIDLYDFYGDNPEKGILAIHFGNYGWDGEPCDCFRKKLAYLMTQTVHGFGMTYYGNQYDQNHKRIDGVEEIHITTQDQWDNVIEQYVLTDPNVIKILNVIKDKCPHIKGFKFYWYNTERDWDMRDDYRRYYRLEYDDPIHYELTDTFFHDWDNDFSGREYLIGFGGVDHQSSGLVYDIPYIEKYLFDNNLKVIITNDNR